MRILPLSEGGGGILMWYATSKFHWTYHAQDKMKFYRLSEARVRRVIHSPKRTEEGIAPSTIAMMQPNTTTGNRGQEKWKQEIWVMVQKVLGVKGQASRVKIISAWRYPGMSKPKSEVVKDLMKQEYRSFISAGR